MKAKPALPIASPSDARTVPKLMPCTPRPPAVMAAPLSCTILDFQPGARGKSALAGNSDLDGSWRKGTLGCSDPTTAGYYRVSTPPHTEQSFLR